MVVPELNEARVVPWSQLLVAFLIVLVVSLGFYLELHQSALELCACPLALPGG